MFILIKFCFLQLYYVPTENPDPYPPVFSGYLNGLAPMIGAKVKWSILSDTVYDNFIKTGKSIIYFWALFPHSVLINHNFCKVIGCEIRDPVWRK